VARIPGTLFKLLAQVHLNTFNLIHANQVEWCQLPVARVVGHGRPRRRPTVCALRDDGRRARSLERDERPDEEEGSTDSGDVAAGGESCPPPTCGQRGDLMKAKRPDE